MDGSSENRDMHPIGTRVRICEDRFVRKVGTVVEHTDDGRMYVQWDGDMIPAVAGKPEMQRTVGPFAIFELTAVRNR